MIGLQFAAFLASLVVVIPAQASTDNSTEIVVPTYIATLSPVYIFGDAGNAGALSAHFEDQDTPDGITVTMTETWGQFTAFKFTSCPSGAEGGYALEAMFGNNMYLRYFDDNSIRVERKSDSIAKGTWTRDTCFKIIPDTTTPTLLHLKEYDGDRYLNIDDGHHAYMTDTAYLFAPLALDDKDSVILFTGPSFTGSSLTLHTDDADLSAHSFDNVVSSIYISGNYAWQMYTGRNYLGQMVVMVPGYYDSDWLAAHLGTNTLSSLKLVYEYDAVALFTGEGFDGQSFATQYNIYDVRHYGVNPESIQSFVIVGPESWEFFTKPYYGGSASVTLSPGRYAGQWVRENMGAIVSVKKIEDNSKYCSMAPGPVMFNDIDGVEVEMELVHHSGAAWFQFGQQNMSDEWNKVANAYDHIQLQLFSEDDIQKLSKLNIMNFEVDSDVTFLAQTEENSYHPSGAAIYMLGSHTFSKPKFVDMPNKATHLMFSPDHLSVRCGTVDPTSTLCGNPETMFPPANQNSAPVIIVSIDMDPHGPGAHADNMWARNQYTWSGSKYLLYAKVTDCMPEFERHPMNNDVVTMQTSAGEDLFICDDWSVSATCTTPKYDEGFVVEPESCSGGMGQMRYKLEGTSHYAMAGSGDSLSFTTDTSAEEPICFTSIKDTSSGTRVLTNVASGMELNVNGSPILFTVTTTSSTVEGMLASAHLPGYHLAIKSDFSATTFIGFNEYDATSIEILDCPAQVGAHMFRATASKAHYLYYSELTGVILKAASSPPVDMNYCFFVSEDSDSYYYMKTASGVAELYVTDDGEIQASGSFESTDKYRFAFEAFALPSFMTGYDIWTYQTSGCVCAFNTNMTGCACCEPGACQCGISSPNQCVRCGFEHSHCGKPSLVEDTYHLEVTDLNVGNDGDHYTVPEQCVTSCTIYVDTEVSSASEVAVHLTDQVDKRRLSCIVLPYGSSEANKMVTAMPSPSTGVPVIGIDMYGFDGMGVIHTVELGINSEGCSESPDVRYAGCYHKPYNASIMDSESTSSTYMTIEKCITHCMEKGFLYAGTRMGTQCSCGDFLPESGTAYDCEYSCAGDRDEICGGQDSYTIFQTNAVMNAGYFLSGSSCGNLGAVQVDTLHEEISPEFCQALTGAATETCTVNYCSSMYVVPGAIYVSKPNRCRGDVIFPIDLQTTGQGCLDLGGVPTTAEDDWGPCTVELCSAGSEEDEVITFSRVGGCASDAKLATVIMDVRNYDCRVLGGAIEDAADDLSIVPCELDLCLFTSTVFGSIAYDLPSVDVQIPVDEPLTVSIPEICVNVMEMYTWAPSGGASAFAQFYHLGEEVSLYAHVDNPVVDMLYSAFEYSTPASGVKIDSVVITAHNNTIEMVNLRLYEVANGCVVEPDAIYLYKDTAFGGEVLEVLQDSTSFPTFDDQTSSFKITGQKMWQVFEDKDYQGRSVVLYPGEYYDTALLPFGDDQMSSARVVYDDDVARADISDANGIICFQRTMVTNYVAGTLQYPGYDNRPETFYFGDMQDRADLCEQACRQEPECVAWTLFLEAYADYDWAGGCYGRSFHYESVEVADTMVVSGLIANCELEDTFNLYPGVDFTGDFITVVENAFNTTEEYLSIVITGTDGWRVILHNGDIYQTYTALPGQYANIQTIMPGSSFVGAIKLHPETQYFGNYTEGNLGDFYPVIETQLEEAFPDLADDTVEYCNETQVAEVSFIVDSSKSIKNGNFKKIRTFIADLVAHFVIGPDNVRVGMVVYASASQTQPSNNPKWTLADYEDDVDGLLDAVDGIPYLKGATYTNLGLDIAHEYVLNRTLCRDDLTRIAIVITDGQSTDTEATEVSSHLMRDDGISIIAIGIKSANYEELVTIAGDQSRVYNVTDFDGLDEIVDAVSKTTCTTVDDGDKAKNKTTYIEEEVPGDDESYFQQDIWEFKRLPYPLGMESGVIVNKQIFARSSQMEWASYKGRLNREGGWISGYNQTEEWIEIDLGKILPIHGVATQGHTVEYAWVMKYKIAISVDGINFEILKANTTAHLVFEGNSDQFTVKHHCLHRIFGQPIKARVIRFIVLEWHYLIGMRIELYGFRDPDDDSLIPVLEKDVWTRSPTGCPCYFEPSNTECACCEDGGCQCPSSNRHQCVQCGYPHNCGTPSVRHMEYNVDGWTISFSGCPCAFNKLRMDCACCQNFGCHCGEQNINQCVNCGHPEHCGLKEWLFGPNPYCMPKTCPSNVDMIEQDK